MKKILPFITIIGLIVMMFFANHITGTETGKIEEFGFIVLFTSLFLIIVQIIMIVLNNKKTN